MDVEDDLGPTAKGDTATASERQSLRGVRVPLKSSARHTERSTAASVDSVAEDNKTRSVLSSGDSIASLLSSETIMALIQREVAGLEEKLDGRLSRVEYQGEKIQDVERRLVQNQTKHSGIEKWITDFEKHLCDLDQTTGTVTSELHTLVKRMGSAGSLPAELQQNVNEAFQQRLTKLEQDIESIGEGSRQSVAALERWEEQVLQMQTSTDGLLSTQACYERRLDVSETQIEFLVEEVERTRKTALTAEPTQVENAADRVTTSQFQSDRIATEVRKLAFDLEESKVQLAMLTDKSKTHEVQITNLISGVDASELRPTCLPSVKSDQGDDDRLSTEQGLLNNAEEYYIGEDGSRSKADDILVLSGSVVASHADAVDKQINALEEKLALRNRSTVASLSKPVAGALSTPRVAPVPAPATENNVLVDPKLKPSELHEGATGGADTTPGASPDDESRLGENENGLFATALCKLREEVDWVNGRVDAQGHSIETIQQRVLSLQRHAAIPAVTQPASAASADGDAPSKTVRAESNNGCTQSVGSRIPFQQQQLGHNAPSEGCMHWLFRLRA